MAEREGGWWSPRFVAGSVALTLTVRLGFVLRFGWDVGFMNSNYLLRAKELALYGVAPAEEPPVTPLLLFAARRLGLSAVGAIDVVYLLAHLVLLFGVLGIGAFLWPSAGLRRRAALIGVVATVPLIAFDSGWCNTAVLVGSAFAAAAVALAGAVAAAPRLPLVRIALLACAAFVAGASRLESLVTCVGAAAVLVGFASLRRLPHALVAALTATVAAAAAVVLSAHFRAPGGANYGFYTFYDGIPLLMFDGRSTSEYMRYRASMRFFGTYAENGGSVARALLAHPLAGIERMVTKIVDIVVVIFRPDCLSPIGAVAAVHGGFLVGKDADLRARSALLLAYVAPLAILFVPNEKPHYDLCIAAPLVLLAAVGLERWTRTLSVPAARNLLVVGVMVLGAVAIAVGRWSPSGSRIINQAVPYLETRCRTGCLTNVLPQLLDRQAWADFEKGAPIVRAHRRSEDAIVGGYAEKHAAEYDFCGRAQRARGAGFAGPILWVEPKIVTTRVFDPDFDPEARYQGTIDLSTTPVEQRFVEGRDEIIIHRLPDDFAATCRPSP